jgi:hypothetical protein
MRRTAAVAVVLTALLCLVIIATVAGQEAAGSGSPPPEKPGFWSSFFDSTFALVLLFIFLPVVVGALIAARQRDRCLKTFHKYHATIVTKTKQRIWGTARVFSKGMVLTYREPVAASGAPTKTSYMLYEPDMETVFAVFRFHDQMAEKNRRRRERQVRRLTDPSPLRRLWRKVRNLINTLRDAFNKAIGAVLGQLQRRQPQAQALTTGGKEIEGIGTTVLGQVANAFEPLLEYHIADPVVLELNGPDEGIKTEYGGELGEYSAGYVMVLDIDADMPDTAAVDGPGAFEERVRARKTQDQVEIENGLGVAVRATAVQVGGQATPLDVEVPAGQTAVLPVSLSELAPAAPQPAEGEDAPPPAPPGPPTVSLVAHRTLDIIAPRTTAIVRHGGIEKRPARNPTPED